MHLTPAFRTRLRRASLMLALGALAFAVAWWLMGTLSPRFVIALVWSDFAMTKWLMQFPTRREEAMKDVAALLGRTVDKASTLHFERYRIPPLIVQQAQEYLAALAGDWTPEQLAGLAQAHITELAAARARGQVLHHPDGHTWTRRPQ